MNSYNVPKVTICVPVRNGAHTIQRTLDSLLIQDYKNYEIIVSDNCSSDNTADIVGKYAVDGVKYFFNPHLESYGESNWNYILNIADGPFIALYHADDIYDPTIVRRQVEFFMEYPTISSVFTSLQYIDEHDRPIRMGTMTLPYELRGINIFPYSDFLNYTLKYRTFVSVPTMMTKREVIEQVGMFNWRKYATASDIDLYLRMSKIGPIGFIDIPLHKYRISPYQYTSTLLHQRTFPDHFFTVMDDHIKACAALKIVPRNLLSLYEVHRAADRVRCAINMLAQERNTDAKHYLVSAINCKTLSSAITELPAEHLKLFILLIAGSLLLLSVHLGIGSVIGKYTCSLLKFYTYMKRKPL